jgi:hypothetical protein
LAPNAGCKNPDTTASGKNSDEISEGAKAAGGDGKADSLLAMTSEAIQHVDQKNRSGG